MNTALRSVSTVSAEFPDIDISKDFSGSEGIKVPLINLDLTGKIDISNLERIKLTKVTAKRLDGSLRLQIVQAIDTLKEQDYSIFKKNIKNNKVVAGLFYAEVSINVKPTRLAGSRFNRANCPCQ